MKNKRILILYDNSSDPLQLQNSRHKVVITKNTTEALSILMGGSSAFGKEDYAKTGKVRPEVLVLDSTFLESYEGFELLEIIRKYYSLQSVRIFIMDKNITPLDPAVFRRYKVSGTIPCNYNLDVLTEESDSPVSAGGAAGAYLSAGFFASQKDWISGCINFIKSKSLIVPALKTAISGKVAVVASCAIVTTVAVSTQMPAQRHEEKTVHTVVTSGIPVTVSRAKDFYSVVDTTLRKAPLQDLQPPALAKPLRPSKKVLVATPEIQAVTVTETVTVVRPEREFRIVIEEAEPMAETEMTH